MDLGCHHSRVLIHSGNWWNMPPERRTTEALAAGVAAISNVLSEGTSLSGVMSINEQPLGGDTPYWLSGSTSVESCARRSLQNAHDALQRLGGDLPVYCTLPVTEDVDIAAFFGEALDAGHTHFAVGASEFLRSPKYLMRGVECLFRALHQIRETVGDAPLHVSGTSAYLLLPFLAACGATSADGSSSVTSALAYGSVVNVAGVTLRANQLATPRGDRWLAGPECGCPVCAGKSRTERASALSGRNGAARVTHNLHIFEQHIQRIATVPYFKYDDWLVEWATGGGPRVRKYLEIYRRLNE
jgi:hypothetical protein